MIELNPFGLDYELRLVAVLLRDRNFFHAWLSIFDSKYVVGEIYGNLIKVFQDFGKKYNRPPDKVEVGVLIQEFLTDKCDNQESYSREVALYMDTINICYAFPLHELEFIKDNALKYLQQKACEQGVMACAKLIGTQQAHTMPGILQSALNVGTNMASFGTDYFASMKERSLKRLATPRETYRIPFFIPKFDEAFGGVGYRQHGCGIPELLMFGGGYNVGKSRAIVHMVKVAAFLGLNVFVFSSEMAEDLYSERLDMSIGLLDTPGLYDPNNLTHLHRRLELCANQGAKVFIKKYPAGTTTIGQTASLVRLAESVLGIDFQLLAWDYTGEFRAENTKADRHLQMAEVVRAQKTAVDEFESAGVGAFQLNRAGYDSEMASLTDAAEDITVAKVADEIIILGQTEEEYGMNPPEMRWCARKVRSQEKNQTVRLIDDRKIMRFRQHPQESVDNPSN